MSYGDTLLTNGSAETGDTTGWDVTNVTVVADVTAGENIQPQLVKDSSIHFDNWLLDDFIPHIISSEATGTNYFLLGATASMEQVILAADIGELPDIDFMVTVDYKLPTAQELYDAGVKSWVEVEVLYNDETKDTFAIPCTAGIDMEDRNLANSWLRVTANIPLRTLVDDLNVTSITITAKTASLTGGLKIDQIKLEKNLETDIGIDGGEEGEVLTTDEDGNPKWNDVPRTFIFTIEGDLSVAVNPCPALPAPRDCKVDKVYAYIKTQIGGPGSEFVTIDILKNGSTMFPAHLAPDKARIPYNQNAAESDTPNDPDISKNDVITMNVDEIGSTSPGSDLTVEVRCK